MGTVASLSGGVNTSAITDIPRLQSHIPRRHNKKMGTPPVHGQHKLKSRGRDVLVSVDDSR
jgi:hypothetical protein